MIKSGYIYLMIVYIVWGSTYLAMRIGIEPGSGFPVFSFGAVRCLIAGIILLLLALLNKKKVSVTKQELLPLAMTGLGMWVSAHGLVLWAEQYIDSGFAAVAVGMAPIWVLVISSIIERHLPNVNHVLFLMIGFTGVGVLMYPQLKSSQANHLISMICLLIASFSWSCCAVYLKKRPFNLSAFTITGYQHLFGSAGFFIISLIAGEPIPTPTSDAWMAMLFLIIFGSVLAFTAYINVLKLLPTELATTNTFVNPIIAVVLGWLILGERITGYTIGAMILVTISITGIILLNKGSAKKAT